MFFDADIKGNRLPPKTVCLTYDDGPGGTPGDGPGPRTEELGEYLFEQGIPATFFVVGRHAEGRAGILRRLREWGHLVANHTYSHPGLVAVATAGGDVVGEVARADAIIREHVTGEKVFFRPPYGNWREKQGPDSPDDRPTSVVADLLNRSGRFPNYVGPVNWDVSAADYDFWRRGASAGECAEAYLEKIRRAGRGIVLMHDSSEEEAVRVNNRTARMTAVVVPALKREGFRFVRLDAVPQVRSAVGVSYQVALRAADGRFLAWETGGSDELALEPSPEGREVFGVVALEGGRVALRASNGLYLSAPQGGGPVLAGGSAVGGGEMLEAEVLGQEAIALRTAGGYYFNLQPGGGSRILADGTSKRASLPLRMHRLFEG